MKRIFPLLVFATSAIAFGQAQLENPGFEGAWENVTGSEDEPAEWSSLKTADALGLIAPVVLFQTDDAHSGSYAVHLVNDVSAGIVANGIMTNGQVHASFEPEEGYVFTNTGNSDWNTPFTDRPDSLVAWIKYAPSGGDRGKLELLLHNNSGDGILPESGSTAHWIGKARFNVEGSYGDWTRISTPFNYYTSGDPTYALMVVSAGDSTVAIEGSQLWIDDIELIYNPPGSYINENESNFDVYANGDAIIVKSTHYEGAIFTVYSMDGRKIQENLLTAPKQSFVPGSDGLFIYRIDIDGQFVTGKIKLD